MFDNLDLREISFIPVGFLECGRCPKYKGSINVFGQEMLIFLLLCKKIFNFGCYSIHTRSITRDLFVLYQFVERTSP